MSGYVISCGGCGEFSSETTFASINEAEIVAAAKGWGMGLEDNGQANYLCPDCGPGFWNFQQLIPSSLG